MYSCDITYVNKYSGLKYEYEYKYWDLKYKYNFKFVLECNSSTSKSTKYYMSVIA